MIRYSAKAGRAYARLYRSYNDIDVYVEDKSYVGVYEQYINRILAGKAKVTRVIPLGPRDVVEEMARNDNDPGGRPRIYIVDGDLDVAAFARMEKIQRLYRLRVYSLENLLTEKSTMEDFAKVACPSMTAGQCLLAVDVAKMIDDINVNLMSYIAALAIARRLKLRGAAFALNPPSVSKLVGGKFISTDSAKLFARKRQIVRACIAAVGITKYSSAKVAVKGNIKRKNLNGLAAAPGKSFVLWYLNERIGAAKGVSVSQAIMVSHMARISPLSIEKNLVRAIKSLAKQAASTTARGRAV